MSSILSVIKPPDFDLDDFVEYSDNKEKKWEYDPLVLAVSLKDFYSKTGTMLSIDSIEVVNNITPDAIAKAEEIRKYYTKKFFWRNITGSKQLSPYRQRLCYLLETRSLVTRDRDIGIYFKIPWFYDEDMIYEDFKKTLVTTNLPKLDYKTQPIAIKLKFLKTSFGWQAKRKLRHFWFSDDSKQLYGFSIQDDNPLLETFESLITVDKDAIFITRVTESNIDNLSYYKLFKYKLIKE